MRRSVALSVAAFAAVAVTAILALRATERLELPLRDAALRVSTPLPATSTVVVAIDEQSIREFGRWPWPRARVADLINRAADAGARAVVLDVLLAERAPGDDQIAAAIRRVQTIAIAALDDHGRWLLPVVAGTVAHGNFELDDDGIVRRFASTKQSGDRALTALSVEAASIITGAPIPVGRSLAPMFRTRPQTIPIISATDFLRGGQRPSAVRTAEAAVLHKIVFFGSTAAGIGDTRLTPVSHDEEPGVMIHAAATESLVRGEILMELPPIFAGLFAGIGVSAILLLRRRRIASAVLITLIAAGGFLLLERAHIAIPFVTLSATALVTLIGVEAAKFRDTAQELQALATRVAARRAHEAESKRVLAHELRTPLASMRGLSQLLGGFELNEDERRRVASLLEAEAGKLQIMVNGLLDLERLPLRDFQASSSVTDLGNLVAKRIEFLKASSDRPLMMSVTPDVFVRADAALLDRIIDNLVGNAIKYSPDGSPVAITVRRNGSDAMVEVEDRGPGIAPSERQKIFDRFFRGAAAAGTAGLGLGLSLVSEVAQWHGGAVSAHDAAGGGSVFTVALPLAAAEEKIGAM